MKFLIRFLVITLTPLAARANDLSEQVLAEINLARTQPQQYAQIVAAQSAGYHGTEGDRAVVEAVNFLNKTNLVAKSPSASGTWVRVKFSF